MSSGQSTTETFHRAAMYVDKMFKGAKPGDLPIEETFELFVNGRTPNALSLIPEIDRGLSEREDRIRQVVLYLYKPIEKLHPV
jgi:hypothetical protein